MAQIFQPNGTGSGGTGSGAKNYLSTYNGNPGNGDFELGNTNNFALGNASLTGAIITGAPTFGSGSSGNLSLSTISSSQLAGTYSMGYVSSAATTAGDFVASSAFTIDIEDQAKMMSFKFYYSAHSGASQANWSGTSSNSFGVAIYDVTNSAWIIPAGIWSMTQSSGVGYATGTFQTSSSGTQYRIVVYNSVVTAGAITLYFDDFFVGPQTAPMGPAISDFGSIGATWTPTGAWSTNSTYTGQWKRIGDQMTAWVHIALAGAPTAASLTINLPAGYTIDTTKLAAVHAGIAPAIGIGSGLSAGTAKSFSVQYNSTTTVSVNYDSSITATITAVNATSPATFANGDYVDVTFTVPIAGWSSNSVQSSDSDTRVVAMQVTGASTAVSAAYATIQWPTIVSDTHAAMGSTQYIVPISGYYSFASQVYLNGTQALNTAAAIQIRKNATTVQEATYPFAAGVSLATAYAIDAGVVKCNAGDLIDVQVKSAATSPAVVASTSDNFFMASRISGPAVVTATETVAASYQMGTTQSIGNGTTFIPVQFNTKIYDTHNAYGTTQYTIPVSGKYTINALIQYATATFSQGNIPHLSLMINSAGAETWLISALQILTTISQGPFIGGSKTVSVNAGDTVAVGTRHDESAGRTIGQTANRNWFDITRVGN